MGGQTPERTVPNILVLLHWYMVHKNIFLAPNVDKSWLRLKEGITYKQMDQSMKLISRCNMNTSIQCANLKKSAKN